MQSKVKIVPAKEEHFKAAGDIAVKAWTPIREEFKRLLGEDIYESFFTNWQEKKKKDIIESLNLGRGYIAMVENQVAGFISYGVDEENKTGEIHENAVDSDFSGMGIGTMMYKFVLDKMREEGVRSVTVTTGGDDAHAPARHSYEKAGFTKYLPSVKYYMNL